MTIVRFHSGREYGEGCRCSDHSPAGRSAGRGGGKRAEVGTDRIVIIGGGPAGYEAALVAAQLDADVTVVEPEGAGGACVLSDCVPSKTFIASSDVVTAFSHSQNLGVRLTAPDAVRFDAAAV